MPLTGSRRRHQQNELPGSERLAPGGGRSPEAVVPPAVVIYGLDVLLLMLDSGTIAVIRLSPRAA